MSESKIAPTVAEIIMQANEMSEEQFTLLFAALRGIHENRREVRERRMSNSLNYGSMVSFDAKTRGVIKGRVIKVNTKTAKVEQTLDAFSGRPLAIPRKWNVSLTLLRKI